MREIDFAFYNRNEQKRDAIGRRLEAVEFRFFLWPGFTKNERERTALTRPLSPILAKLHRLTAEWTFIHKALFSLVTRESVMFVVRSCYRLTHEFATHIMIGREPSPSSTLQW